MRPILFLIGLITVIYVIDEWIRGYLQYSIEGYAGNTIYSIIHYFDANTITHSLFMAIVYLFTLMFGIGLMMMGVKGKKKKGGN